MRPAKAIQDQLKTEAPVQKPEGTPRQFGFSVGGYNLLIESGVYSEFLLNISASSLPNSGRHVEGLINVRGNVVPLYDISELLGSEKKKLKTALLIGKPELGAALLIENRPHAIELPKSPALASMATIPELLSSSCEKALSLEGTFWFELNHDRFFSLLASSTNPLVNRSDEHPTTCIQ